MRVKTKKEKIFYKLALIIVALIIILTINNEKNEELTGIDEEIINQSSDNISKDEIKKSEVLEILEQDNMAESVNETKEYLEVDPLEEGNLNVEEHLTKIANGVNIDYVNAIINLEDKSYLYLFENGTITDDMDEKTVNNIINNVVMSILRKDRYYDGGSGMNDIFWGTIAGSTDPNIKSVLKLLDTDLEAAKGEVDSDILINGESVTEAEIIAIQNLIKAIIMIEQSDDFLDPITKENIDFIHMIASLDSIYSDVDMDDDIEVFVDNLAGWGGDLKTFLPDLLKEIDDGKIYSKSEYKDYVKTTLGSTVNSHFSLEDLLADIDAVNVNSILKSEDLLLSEGIIWYYNSRAVERRYSSFVESFSSVADFKTVVKILLFYETVNIEDVSQYGFPLEDLVGVYAVFEDFFEHRSTTEEELNALYEGFTEIILDRMELEAHN